MPITSFASPTTLTWGKFLPSSTRLRDPHDGTLVDSVVEFDWALTPNLPAQRSGSHFVVDNRMFVLITPRCRVWTGVRQTAALLAHEQFHYDVAIVIARVVAAKLNRMRGSSQADLRRQIATLMQLHFGRRNDLIQQRYDIDTRHGTNAHYQAIWKARMSACLSNANATQIGGFFL